MVLMSGGRFGLLYFGFGLTLAPTLLALPFFAVLDRKGHANAVTSIGTGIAMGTILSGLAPFLNADAVPAFGGLGALGGAAFWSALKLGGWWRGDADAPDEPEQF